MVISKKDDIILEFVKRTDERYQDIRNRHYVPNKGTHGQQIHFIIHYKGSVVGIISGASSVYGVKSRDMFFNIPQDKEKKQRLYLPAIINNTVFRLEYHEKNLATRVLSKWRKVISELWEKVYGVPVIGFETFVVEEDFRKGTLYLADNWEYCGDTVGSTKSHKGLLSPSTRTKTEVKMVYCKWIGNTPKLPEIEYVSSWRAETKEEKERARRLSKVRTSMLGRIFI